MTEEVVESDILNVSKEFFHLFEKMGGIAGNKFYLPHVKQKRVRRRLKKLKDNLSLFLMDDQDFSDLDTHIDHMFDVVNDIHTVFKDKFDFPDEKENVEKAIEKLSTLSEMCLKFEKERQ